MNLSRIACKYADITVSATLANGSAATLGGVDLALVPPGGSPDGATAWTASIYDAGVAVILVAGPDFPNPPVGALIVPSTGGDLWARVTDIPEVDAALVDRIALI